MSICPCYHDELNFLLERGVCYGTKEKEACSCGGDESKCDFYEDKRKKATPKPITNADRIRAMTDEELSVWLIDFCCADYGDAANARVAMYRSSLLDWLKQEAQCTSE